MERALYNVKRINPPKGHSNLKFVLSNRVSKYMKENLTELEEVD
jgi:hypothetical protein